MAKGKIKETSLKEVPILELLSRLEQEKDDVQWMNCWEELMERSPFQGMIELIENSDVRINDLEKKNKELELLLRLHKHMGDDVVQKI